MDDHPERLELSPLAWVARSDIRFSFSRSRGPGGQAVNKLSTRAELRVALSAIRGLTENATRRLRRLAGQRLTQDDELIVHADVHRSQLRNKEACLERLADLVERATREPKRRKPTRPSRAKVEKRLALKRQQGEKKQRRAQKKLPED